GDEMVLTVKYRGRLAPQPPDREALTLQDQQGEQPGGAAGIPVDELFLPQTEPNFLYSNRTYWYPQAPSSQYATATMHITVPAEFECIATGQQMPGSPTIIPAQNSLPAVKVFLFTVPQPVRYL